MQNSTFKTIALTLFVVGLAMAGFRAFSDTQQPSDSATNTPREQMEVSREQDSTEKAEQTEEFSVPEELVRCVVVSEDDTERILYYPKTAGCPGDEVVEDEVVDEQEESEQISPEVEEGFSDDIALVESRDLRVSSPSPDDAVSSPFQVTGEARNTVDKVYIRITNPDGKSLIEQAATVRSTGSEWNTYDWTIHYEFQNTKQGFVEVYTKHGNKEENMLKVPVSFS